MEEEALYPPDYSDLDLSFTSCSTTTTDRSTISARSSLARSSLTLSFNESRLSSTSAPSSSSSSTCIPNLHRRPHRRHDSNWAAIKAATTLSSDGALHLRHLKLLRLLGSGNLGRVFHCRLRDYDHASFALKVVDRDSLTPKKLSHVQTEAEILSSLDHPFLPTLYAHLEVSHYTCLLIDYCPNGDLHSLLRKQPRQRFDVDAVRFYAAQVLVALEYLHALGIVYRDLKPENILIREDGHIMLSDFDLCFKSDVSPRFENKLTQVQIGCRKYYSTQSCLGGCGCDGDKDGYSRQDQKVTAEFVAEPTSAFSRSCVGTHEYLAPELVSGGGHGNGVDWWAFGVLIYELLYGTTPFKGGTKDATLRNIASTKGVRFLKVGGEDTGTTQAADLIEKLLVKDSRKRLGCISGATDIKRHPFFKGIKWPLIRSYRPPDIRGMTVKRSKSKRHVTGMLSPGGRRGRRRSWWLKKLGYFLMKRSSNTYTLNSNQNYYCYNVNNYKHTKHF